jgi:hypothetical protein
MVGSGLMADGRRVPHHVRLFNSFFFEMINGRGWIAIALVVFGAWSPWKSLIWRALLFAAFDALPDPAATDRAGRRHSLPGFPDDPLHPLHPCPGADVARRANVPAALMVPYNRGER